MNSIVVHDVYKRFPNGTQALSGVSLEIPAGQIFGVLGPNGAVNTTLMNMLTTLLLPARGDIQILGRSTGDRPGTIRQRLNLCSGNANFASSLTVRENLRFYAMLYGMRGKAREDRLD